MQYHARKWFNNTSVNAMAAIAIGAMLIFSVAGTKAFADNVQDDIESNVSSSQTITAGGVGLDVQYWIVANKAAGSPEGCDAADGSSAKITFNVPSGVTVSPASLTFNSCAEGSDKNAQTATYTSNTPGTYAISVSASDSAGSYKTESAEFTLTVKPAAQPDPDPDGTAPIITEKIVGTAGSGDWYTSDVQVSWTVVEDESPDSLQTTGCDTRTISTDTTGTDVTCEATSDGGSNSKTVTIKRDATKPEITVSSGISNGDEFYFGDVPNAPTCDATDATSDVDDDGCQVSGYNTAVGSHTLKFTAKDNAGNTETQEITYTVLSWTIKGFYQPVDMNGVTNLVKAGSTVPLKFEVFKGSTELTDISVRDTVTQKKVTCDTGATVDDIEQYTTTGQTTFRYDSSSGQFIDNWKSPTTKNACYQVTMTFDDGSSVAALFRTK